LDRGVAARVLASSEMRRPMQLPELSATTAATLIAAVGTLGRFSAPRHLVGYLDLNPKVRQSGSEPASTGGIFDSTAPRAVRAVLTEAAWVA
jgi:transposase